MGQPIVPGNVDNLIETANTAFEQDCFDRHAMGEKKYGDGTFLDKDTIRMAMDEAIDIANYMRYTYVKLFLMREGVMNWEGDGVAKPREGMENMGKNAVFLPMQRRPRE